MSILAVALFGSWARGDQTPGSDTDLLMITEDGEAPWHSTFGSVSLSYYPRADLNARAARGDLFLCHVLTEGRPLYDPHAELAALRNRFTLRASYAEDIARAAALGWLFVRFGGRFAASPLAARRTAWVVRTILIARAAEAGRPRFSARDLAPLAPIPETLRLIGQKSNSGLKRSAMHDLRRFLEWADLPDPAPRAATPDDYRTQFEASANSVGTHFLNSLQRRPPAEGYA